MQPAQIFLKSSIVGADACRERLTIEISWRAIDAASLVWRPWRWATSEQSFQTENGVGDVYRVIIICIESDQTRYSL